MIDLTVAIVSYNSGSLIIKGLSDVLSSNFFLKTVVDNNSQDNSVELLCKKFPGLDVVSLEQNIGYGRAANIALHNAKTQFVLLLNPDIEVSADDIIDLFKKAKSLNSAPAICAPATRAEEYTRTGWQDVSFVLGAVMLFNLNELRKHGFFDENFFLFYEEKDLCLRVINEGGKVLRLSDTLFAHRKGTSSGEKSEIVYLKQWHVGWSSMYYLTKHKLRRGRFRLPVVLMRYALKRYLSFTSIKRQKYKARLGGVLSFWRGKKAFDKRGQPRMIEVLDFENKI